MSPLVWIGLPALIWAGLGARSGLCAGIRAGRLGSVHDAPLGAPLERFRPLDRGLKQSSGRGAVPVSASNDVAFCDAMTARTVRPDVHRPQSDLLTSDLLTMNRACWSLLAWPHSAVHPVSGSVEAPPPPGAARRATPRLEENSRGRLHAGLPRSGEGAQAARPRPRQRSVRHRFSKGFKRGIPASLFSRRLDWLRTQPGG